MYISIAVSASPFVAIVTPDPYSSLACGQIEVLLLIVLTLERDKSACECDFLDIWFKRIQGSQGERYSRSLRTLVLN
jgi:hypothetical protein